EIRAAALNMAIAVSGTPDRPTRQDEEDRTRRALLHMLEDLQRERDLILAAKHQWLDTVDAVADLLMVHDAEFRIVRANKAYAALAGVDFPEIIGRPYWECFPRGDGPLAGCVGGACAASAGHREELRLPGGEIYSSRAFMQSEGLASPLLSLHLFENITQRKREEEIAHSRALRELAQAAAFSAIASSQTLFNGDIEQLAREITEQTAHAGGVERANVWLFNADETELHCIDHYDSTARSHSTSPTLSQQQFEKEFKALKIAPYVAADDALTDPRTSGYAEGYLKPNRITSMLDAVVEISGRHLGLLCLEHVGEPHHWEEDEIAFAVRVAEKIAIAISNRSARQAEQAMRASEVRFRTIFEQAPVGISESSTTGRYQNVNERLCQITGYSAQELLSMTFRDVTHAEDLARDELNLAALLSGQATYYSAEKRYVQKSGNAVWVSLLVTPVRDADGAILHLLTIAEEITARKEAETQIRALARFPQENPNPVMRMTAEGRVLYANPASAPLQRLCNVSAAGQAQGHCMDIVRECLVGGESREVELEHEGRLFLVVVAPILEEGYANIYGQDITERRRAERALEGRERYYRNLIEGSSDSFFVIDKAGRVVYRSESGVQLTGYDSAEVLGKELTAFVRPESLPAARRVLAGIVGQPGKQSRVELRISRKDGSEVEVEAIGRNLLGDPDVNGIIVTVRDITERKQAERSLRRLNRALKTLSAGNVALIHASGEADLLQEMTRILHEVGGYPLAIVGYAGEGSSDSVVLKASSGVRPDSKLQLPGSWAESDHGQSAVARAIRFGETQLVRNVDINTGQGSWGEIFGALNIAVIVGLPLRDSPGARPFGAIGIGASESEAFDDDELKLLQELAGDLAYGIANLRAGIEQLAATEKLRRGLENTIDAIAATMETRDPYTAGHQRRVAELASAIAREMNLPGEIIAGIHFGALIHDIGKMQVPSEILSKPTRLSKLEYELIKTHAQAGYDIIKGVDFPWPVALMVLQHHERLDGSGYPQGLKGEDIIAEARILAVADVVEAMSSHRPYRPGLGIESALKEIADKRGFWFEPDAVDACLRLFREKSFVFETIH
ncbi:MAG: PAS domain S-box protein, partial [Betaproteobacteria bacterium]